MNPGSGEGSGDPALPKGVSQAWPNLSTASWAGEHRGGRGFPTIVTGETYTQVPVLGAVACPPLTRCLPRGPQEEGLRNTIPVL